jgi:hypothetical protein
LSSFSALEDAVFNLPLSLRALYAGGAAAPVKLTPQLNQKPLGLSGWALLLPRCSSILVPTTFPQREIPQAALIFNMQNYPMVKI